MGLVYPKTFFPEQTRTSDMCDAFGQVWAELVALQCSVISVRLSYYNGFRWSVEVSPEDFIAAIGENSDEVIEAVPIGSSTLFVIEWGAFDLTCKVQHEKREVTVAEIELREKRLPLKEFEQFGR